MKYKLRVWMTQILGDCRDYELEAESLEAAAQLIDELTAQANHQAYVQNLADEIKHDKVLALHLNDRIVRPLDPDEIIGSDNGVQLIDDNDNVIRDVIGHCETHGSNRPEF